MALEDAAPAVVRRPLPAFAVLEEARGALAVAPAPAPPPAPPPPLLLLLLPCVVLLLLLVLLVLLVEERARSALASAALSRFSVRSTPPDSLTVAVAPSLATCIRACGERLRQPTAPGREKTKYAHPLTRQSKVKLSRSRLPRSVSPLSNFMT